MRILVIYMIKKDLINYSLDSFVNEGSPTTLRVIVTFIIWTQSDAILLSNCCIFNFNPFGVSATLNKKLMYKRGVARPEVVALITKWQILHSFGRCGMCTSAKIERLAHSKNVPTSCWQTITDIYTVYNGEKHVFERRKMAALSSTARLARKHVRYTMDVHIGSEDEKQCGANN